MLPLPCPALCPALFDATFAPISVHPAASILLAPGEVPPVHGADEHIHARVDAR